MQRPSPAILGSLALHAGVAALALISWPRQEPRPIPSSVPVTIVSEMTVAAAAPDNPSEELIEDDAATAPVPSEPEPQPEPEPAPPPLRPAPTPAPRPPEKAPTPRPTPQPTPPKKAEPARPTPPRPTPPATPPRRNEPTLDLDALSGPTRPSRNPGRQAPTGQTGSGAAPQAIGRADLQALARQISPHWNPPCDLPGGADLTLSVRARLGENGRVIGTPTIVQRRSDATWRVASDGIMRAIAIAAPFDMPAGYEEQEVTFTFQTATFCGNR